MICFNNGYLGMFLRVIDGEVFKPDGAFLRRSRTAWDLPSRVVFKTLRVTSCVRVFRGSVF